MTMNLIPRLERRQSHVRKHKAQQRTTRAARRSKAAGAVATPYAPLLEFIHTYLPHQLYGEMAPFQLEIQAALESSTRTAIAAPRGHGKSSLITLGHVLHSLAYRRKKFVVLIGASSDLAEKSLGRIGAELRENEALLKAFPHLALPTEQVRRARAKKAKDSDLQLSGGARLSAVGAGAALRGLIDGANRPDEIILDDIETDKSVETPEQRQKLLDWYLSAVSNLPGANGGAIRMVGTLLHKSSLLATLLSPAYSSSYTQLRYAALNAEGNPLWVAAWTLEKLEVKRAEIGSRVFSKEYLNNPVDATVALWKESWIADNRVMSAPPLERIVVSIDPSSGTGEGDSCGINVSGVARGQYYVLEDATIYGSPREWGLVALQKYRQYGASLIVAEGNQGGAMVTEVLRGALLEGETLPLIKIVHASVGKVARAEPIAALYEAGIVHHVGTLPWLETELLEWVPGMKSPGRMDSAVWGLHELSSRVEPQTVTTSRPRSVAL